MDRERRRLLNDRALVEEISKQLKAKPQGEPAHYLSEKRSGEPTRKQATPDRSKGYHREGLKKPKIKKIDLLSKAIHFSAEQYKLLQELLDRFAQKLSILLSNTINHRVIVSLDNLRDREFGSFLDALPSPIVVIIFDLQITKAIISLDPYFSFVMLNLLLGGVGEPPWELREMTKIENKLFISLIASKIISAFNEMWQVLNPEISASIEKLVMDPGGAMVYPYNEPVLVANFSIRLDELEAPASLVLPVAYLKEVLITTKSSSTSSKVYSSLPPVSINPELAQKITKAASALLGGKTIEYSKVEVIVELGEAEVTFGDLLNLEVGDIIELETKQTDLIKVKVSGKTKFLGRPGIVDNRYSVRIEKILTEEEAELYDQPRW